MSTGSITRTAGTAAASEERVVRYTFPERAAHWINGLAYTYCMLTGLAFFTPYLYWIAAVLGGGPTVRFWHPWVGLVYLVAVLWMHSKWKADMGPHANDKQFKDNIKNYIQNRDDKVPAQERFNAGQKQFWWVMFWCTWVLLVTGIVMWFPEMMPRGLHWLLTVLVFVHSATALITIAAFIIHVYMSVWMTPGSMQGMMDGTVSARWARAHHRLWYERITGRK